VAGEEPLAHELPTAGECHSWPGSLRDGNEGGEAQLMNALAAVHDSQLDDAPTLPGPSRFQVSADAALEDTGQEASQCLELEVTASEWRALTGFSRMQVHVGEAYTCESGCLAYVASDARKVHAPHLASLSQDSQVLLEPFAEALCRAATLFDVQTLAAAMKENIRDMVSSVINHPRDPAVGEDDAIIRKRAFAICQWRRNRLLELAAARQAQFPQHRP